MADDAKKSKARKMTTQEKCISHAKGILGEHIGQAVIIASINDPKTGDEYTERAFIGNPSSGYGLMIDALVTTREELFGNLTEFGENEEGEDEDGE